MAAALASKLVGLRCHNRERECGYFFSLCFIVAQMDELNTKITFAKG